VLDASAFRREFSLREALTVTLRSFFNLGESGLVPRTRHGRWLLESPQLIGVVSIAYAVFSLARPVVWRRTSHQRARERARDLITAYGDSSLDYFKYSDDKLFFFPLQARGVVSFGLANGVAVVLGDPVAASDDDFTATLREFLDLCETNDWEPALLQATPKRLAAYRYAGLSVVKIGEEAVVDLDRFTLQGRAMKDLRHPVRRLERDGYRVVFSPPPQPDELLEKLRAVSEEWLSIGRHRERRFTLGRFEDAYIRSSPIFAVESPHGDVVAFANLIPDGKPGEATIDLMRRRRQPAGVMEFLFVAMFLSLREQGYHSFPLGMAPFANVGVDPDSPFVERVLRQAYEHLNRLFSYKGLRSFKAKFEPIWEARDLVYRSDLALPKVALAIVRLTE
jgi:phosphatidylglycerol lysyltransferase